MGLSAAAAAVDKLIGSRVLQHRFFPLFMSTISPFTVVALNSSRVVERPLSPSPCDDEIQHVKKTSHVDIVDGRATE